MLWGRLNFGYLSFRGMVIEFQVATLDLRMGPKQSEYGAVDLAIRIHLAVVDLGGGRLWISRCWLGPPISHSVIVH